MKYIAYKLLFCIGLVMQITACTNEESIITPTNNEMSIHVSIQEKNANTRAGVDTTEILDIEKIHRYDIFMYNHAADTLCKYIGADLETADVSFTVNFLSEAAFQDDLDVYVVVNDYTWKNKTDISDSFRTSASLKALTFSGNQNYIGTESNKKDKSSMTVFSGYKKESGAYEPFIMSTATTHNFQENSTLSVKLKRTYAKVILAFITSLTAAEDPDLISLKYLSIKRFANIADVARIFSTSGTGYTPATSTYAYTDASVFSRQFNNLDLTQITGNSNVYDTFLEGANCLRVFPHAPASKSQATALDISFGVGAVAGNDVTKVFHRNILIGDSTQNYRIDPNTAYIVTITTNKTDDDITVSTKVAPWNMVYAELPVTPLP